jgi:LPXTG-motif cell wall-anchored protein
MLSRAALLAVVLALSVVAVASAQSAGDEQYQDPFAGSGGGSSGGGSSGGGSSAPAAPAPTAAAAPAAPAAAASAATPSARPQLPRTGDDAWPLALGGLALVLAGVGLRLRLRADGEPRR